MRISRLALSAVAAATLAAALPEAGAVATRVSGRAGEVRDIRHVSGSTLLAATQGGGIFRSDNSGQDWSLVTTFPSRYVWKIAVAPTDTNRIYAATESGLYRSTNGGTDWTQLTRDTTRAVAVDPASATTLLIGVPGMGILKSTNSGDSWTRSSSGLDSTNVLHIAYASSSQVFAALNCNVEDGSQTGDWGGVFESTNDGGTWTNQNTRNGVALPTKCVTSLAVGGSTVLVGTIPPNNPGGGKIHRTTTAGAAWSNPADNNVSGGHIYGVEHLSVQAGNATTFWAGAREVGVWKSTDSGVTWTQQVNQGTDPAVFSGIYSVGTISGSNVVLAGVKGLGLMRSTTGASPWILPTASITADRVRSVSNAGNTYYMALENGGVMRSLDAGGTWTQLNNGLQVGSDFIRNPQVIAVNPTNPNVVNVGMRANGLYTLNVGTSTWTTSGVTAGLFDGGVVHLPQSMAYTLGGEKFFYSLFDAGTKGGLWQGANVGSLASAGVPIFDSNPGLDIAPGGYRVIASTADGNRLYFLVFDSAAYRTTNGGTSWSRVNVTHTGFMRIGFYDIADRPGTSTSVATTNKGIFRSTNGGADWARISATGLTQMSLSTLAYSSNGTLWGGDLGGGFWCSTDNGSTWAAVNKGALPSAAIREVRFLNGQVHALTDGAGIYKNDPSSCP